MHRHQTAVYPVRDRSLVSEVRRAANAFARANGFHADRASQAELVTTELATNLVKHAGGGEILLTIVDYGNGQAELQIIAADKGPGMGNVTECLRDGYSTAGSPGTGLGAVHRLSDTFDVYSRVSAGTVLLSCLAQMPSRQSTTPMTIGTVCRAKQGQDLCGDSWAILFRPPSYRFLVADGLGHGLHASEAACAATRLFSARHSEGLPEMIETLHTGLRSTRGAAVGVAEVNVARAEVEFVGVGNIGGVVIGADQPKHLASMNGTVGVEMRKVTPFSYSWPQDGALILYSDGLVSHWKLDAYPGLFKHHPAVVAGVLFRDLIAGGMMSRSSWQKPVPPVRSRGF